MRLLLAMRPTFSAWPTCPICAAPCQLQTIVDATNVSQTLWDGLESNDLSKWPNGVFARAFVKEYAKLVGLNADATVDEFCRCFPQGDRRAEPTMRASAEIVNHELEWQDYVPPAEGDRRASASAPAASKAKPPEGCFQGWPVSAASSKALKRLSLSN